MERRRNEEKTETAKGSPGERQDNRGKSPLFPLGLSLHTCIPAKLADQDEGGKKLCGEGEVCGY